jgi:hypothetical protein
MEENAKRLSMESREDQAKRLSMESEGKFEEEQDDEDDANKRHGVKKFEVFEKVIDYVDDTTKFRPKWTRRDRVQYWSWVSENKWRPTLPPDFVSWLNQYRMNDYDLEIKYYPLGPVVFVRFCTSYYLDYAYIYLFMLWLVLLGLSTDGFLDGIVTLDPSLVALPLMLMMVTQVIAIVGGLVGVVYFNDLTKFLAIQQISKWVLKALVVSRFMYLIFSSCLSGDLLSVSRSVYRIHILRRCAYKLS